MADPDLPTEVRDLITANLDSSDQIEVLLLLLRSPSRIFSVDEMARTLGLDVHAVGAAAHALHHRRLLTTVGDDLGAYQYATATLTQHAAVEALALAWEATPVAVMKMLYESSDRDLRTFADAFRLRRRGTL